jgi:hypothetical protein
MMSHKLSLGLLRAGCALVLVVTTALFAASIPARFSQLNQLAPELNLQSGTLGSQEAAALEAIGLSLPAYAGYITTMEALTAFAGILVGAIIFWRRRNDPMALFVSIALATLGTFPTPLMTYFSTLNPFWAGALSILQFIAIGPSFLIFYLFPDGRFVPEWTKWFGISWLLYVASWLIFPAIRPPITLFAVSAVSPAILLFLVLWISVGVYAQIFRYRQHASQTQRQQTKWIVFGFSLTLIVIILVGTLARLFLHDTGTPSGMLMLLIGISIALIALSITPVTVMVSILQYRLWDIDLIIRRTLSYAIMSGLLGLIYFGGVVGLQAIFSMVTEQNSTISIILSTLAIAALFTPVRIRVQDFIDRRFYRKKYDAEQALAQFAAAARDEVDMERLTLALLGVVEETMQPEQVSLWLVEDR